MKFTAQQVLEKIKASLGKTQKLSDRTILDAVTNTMAILGDDSEMELEAFVEKVSPTIASMNTNFNDEQGRFVKEYQKKNPRPKDDGDKDKRDDNEPDNDEPEWARRERERREKWEKEHEARLERLATEKRTDSLRTSVVAKFKESLKAELERNPNIAKGLEQRYATVLSTIGESDTEETLTQRLTDEFNYAKTLAGDGYIPSDGTGGGGNTGTKFDANDPAVRDALVHEGVKFEDEGSKK